MAIMMSGEAPKTSILRIRQIIYKKCGFVYKKMKKAYVAFPGITHHYTQLLLGKLANILHQPFLMVSLLGREGFHSHINKRLLRTNVASRIY